MYLYIVQICGYLNIVQMDEASQPAGPQGKQGKPLMSALTQIGRVFDSLVGVAFVFISLSLVGATAAAGV